MSNVNTTTTPRTYTYIENGVTTHVVETAVIQPDGTIKTVTERTTSSGVPRYGNAAWGAPVLQEQRNSKCVCITFLVTAVLGVMVQIYGCLTTHWWTYHRVVNTTTGFKSHEGLIDHIDKDNVPLFISGTVMLSYTGIGCIGFGVCLQLWILIQNNHTRQYIRGVLKTVMVCLFVGCVTTILVLVVYGIYYDEPGSYSNVDQKSGSLKKLTKAELKEIENQMSFVSNTTLGYSYFLVVAAGVLELCSAVLALVAVCKL